MAEIQSSSEPDSVQAVDSMKFDEGRRSVLKALALFFAGCAGVRAPQQIEIPRASVLQGVEPQKQRITEEDLYLRYCDFI